MIGKMRNLHIIYGIAIFIFLALAVVGFSYYGNQRSKCQKLSGALKARNAENAELASRVESLEKELGTTASQLRAKTTEADMLNSALSDLRKQINGSAVGKTSRLR